MHPTGHYIQPAGELSHRTPFYAIRYNPAPANMSKEPLGLQVWIKYLDFMMWINIEETWITQGDN